MKEHRSLRGGTGLFALGVGIQGAREGALGRLAVCEQQGFLTTACGTMFWFLSVASFSHCPSVQIPYSFTSL